MCKESHTQQITTDLSVVVMPDGWLNMYKGKPVVLADIPKPYHNLIKATVKSVAYDAGFYTMTPPTGPTALWDKVDWINHVKFDFDI